MKILEEYGIEEDPRLKRAGKEAKIIWGYMLAMWIFCLATWGVGSHFDPGTSMWIIGMPAYVFWFVIVGGVAFTVAGIYIAWRLIKDCSLESKERKRTEGME